MKTKMNKSEVIKQFKLQWKEFIQLNPDCYDDAPLKRTMFNDYTDFLCKDGIITQKQYNTITLD